MKKKKDYKNWLTKDYLKEKSLSNGCFWCNKVCGSLDCPYKKSKLVLRSLLESKRLPIRSSFAIFLADWKVRNR